MYNYETERPKLFTEKGLDLVIRIRDRAHFLIKQSGAVRLDRLIDGICEDNWLLLACVDYLVERREILDVSEPDPITQYRIFTIR